MARITSTKQGAARLRIRTDAESDVVSINATGEPWDRIAYGMIVHGVDRAYEVTLTPEEVRMFFEWPEFAKLNTIDARPLELARMVARLNPDAGEIGAGMLAELISRASRCFDE